MSQTARRTSPFFKWSGPASRGVDIGGFKIDLPIPYYRTDCFLAIFDADYEAARAMLPSERLFPVRGFGGRAAVGIVGFNYIQTGVGPYGEIGIVVLCTLDRQAPPLVPLALESKWPGFGAFVAHLPVTSRIARQAGRTVWGYPKFVADMAFDFMPEYQSVEMREGGREILSLTVPRKGFRVRDNRPLVTFTAREGQLVRTQMPWRSVCEMSVGRGAGGNLALGNHPVADELRALGLPSAPTFTKSYLAHAAILPEGEVLGDTDRAYEGFAGSGRLFGRHTVRYDRGVEQVISEADEAVVADEPEVAKTTRRSRKAAGKSGLEEKAKTPRKAAGKVAAGESAKGSRKASGKRPAAKTVTG